MPKASSGPTNSVKQNTRTDSKQHDPKREGWSAQDLGEESSYEGTTEISRRLRRGDETVGNPDERDVAGAIPEKDMPHGRELRRTPSKSRKK
jgi:hypothetical protein